MNWERAKTVLIVAFLLLDLFLFWLWSESNREAAYIGGGLSGEAELLKNKFTQFSLTVPDWKGTPPKMRYWSLEDRTPEIDRIVQKVRVIRDDPASGAFDIEFSERVPLKTLEDGEALKHLLSAEGEWLAGGRGVWRQTLDGFPIFDATVRARLDGEFALGLEGHRFAVGEGGEARSLISPYVAVYALADRGLIPPGSAIERFIPGYRRVTPKDSAPFLVPVWRIVVGDRAIDANGFLGTPIPVTPQNSSTVR
ncbi:MAG: two-component system regulatory protein YycI [Hydrogenibacillus sp.]|nr:two-component system regulatory protein YycI [Hydrogenibacillus sp.]